MPQQVLKIEGLDKLDRRLKELPDKLRRRVMRSALTKAGEPIREAMSRKARRAPTPTHPETGHLADNIIVGKPKLTQDGGSVNIGPSKDAFWGLFLEFGTDKMPAVPFARPAFDLEARNALDIIVDELKDGIERFA